MIKFIMRDSVSYMCVMYKNLLIGLIVDPRHSNTGCNSALLLFLSMWSLYILPMPVCVCVLRWAGDLSWMSLPPLSEP